jgi:hypothetical protein
MTITVTLWDPAHLIMQVRTYTIKSSNPVSYEYACIGRVRLRRERTR